MEKILLKHAKVILDDEGGGKADIIIDGGLYGYNSSYGWGAMGCSLKEFLLKIDEDYFVGNLCSERFTFSAKASVSNVRRLWKQDGPFEWWENMEFQKSLRAELREIAANCKTEEEFVDNMFEIGDAADFNLIDSDYDQKGAEGFFTTEPWHMIEKVESEESKWFKKVFKQLQKYLIKEAKHNGILES